MGISKGVAICPIDDNSIFVIRKHGTENFIPTNKAHSLSRQTSIQSYQSRTSRLTLDEDLEALQAANMIFIRHVQRRTAKLSQAQNKYTIVNTTGETLFYAIESTSTEVVVADPQKQDHPKHLKFVVVNSQGEKVFDVEFDPGLNGFGARATVRRDSTVLGSVAETNKVSSCQHKRIPPSYLIEAPDGRTLQKILQQSSWKNAAMGLFPVNDYNILSPDGSICKAKVSRQTNAITLEEYSQTDTYALSFHTTDMDGKLKALLVAAILILDCQLTQRVAEMRDYKSLLFRILVCAILVLVFIGIIIVVVDNAIEFEKDKPKRFPGHVPPP